MLRPSIHYGLKRSSRLAALCGQRPPLPAAQPHRPRRFNGGKRKATSAERARSTEDEDSSNLTFSTDTGFQGFPQLEGKRQGKQKLAKGHLEPVWRPRPSKDKAAGIQDVEEGSVEQSIGRGVVNADVSRRYGME